MTLRLLVVLLIVAFPGSVLAQDRSGSEAGTGPTSGVPAGIARTCDRGKSHYLRRYLMEKDRDAVVCLAVIAEAEAKDSGELVCDRTLEEYERRYRYKVGGKRARADLMCIAQLRVAKLERSENPR